MLSARSLVVALGLLSLLACSKKPKNGEACEDNGSRACVDPKTSVYCFKGTWQAEACNGPKGCTLDRGVGACDVTGDVEGDVCPTALEGWSACKADGKTRLTCKGGKYSAETCSGAEGCTLERAGMATCDRGPAQIGSTCSEDPRIQHCDLDKHSFVVCGSDHKYVLAQKCPGANGCTEQGGGLVACDPNGAFVEGDLCVLITGACTSDGAAQLQCENGKLVKKLDCPGPDRCQGVICDTGVAKLDDPCAIEGKQACSDDGKALLECKTPKAANELEPPPTKWTKTKACKTGCTPKEGKLECT